jgi:hypothetical protein
MIIYNFLFSGCHSALLFKIQNGKDQNRLLANEEVKSLIIPSSLPNRLIFTLSNLYPIYCPRRTSSHGHERINHYSDSSIRIRKRPFFQREHRDANIHLSELLEDPSIFKYGLHPKRVALFLFQNYAYSLSSFYEIKVVKASNAVCLLDTKNFPAIIHLTIELTVSNPATAWRYRMRRIFTTIIWSRQLQM